MIQVFYGDDRVCATNAIKQFLGTENYEVIDCADLTPTDLPTIFYGATFFDTHRTILLRDFFANRAVAEELEKYLDTSHDIAILESKLDKRSVAYKNVQDKLKFTEFKLPVENFGLAFDVYRTAKTNGSKAVAMLKSLEISSEPQIVVGAWASQAIKDYVARPADAKTKRALVELSKLDLQTKTISSQQPWLLLESFLLRLSSL